MNRGKFAAFFLLWGGSLHAQERVAVRTEPGTPIVAMELLVATGPVDEAAKAGLAHLAGRTVTHPIRPALDSLGARLTVHADKDALTFGLLAPPDTWSAAARLLLAAVFRNDLRADAVTAERRAIQTELLSKEANPVNTLAREMDIAVFGSRHPWARPAAGYARTVEKLSAAEVEEFVRANVLPERSWVAVVGPVDSAAVADVTGGFIAPARWEVPIAPEPSPARSPVRRTYNYITSWVAASYPFGPDADVPALTLLADMVADQLGFGPTRRGVYDASGEVVTVGEGGEVRFHVVVRPEQAREWTGRLQDVVSMYAEQPLSEAAFREQLRRYRGLQMMRLNAPEARARATARALLRSGGRERTPISLDGVSAERIQAAAQALERPVLVTLGPAVSGRGD